jgi:hypothetical protein
METPQFTKNHNLIWIYANARASTIAVHATRLFSTVLAWEPTICLVTRLQFQSHRRACPQYSAIAEMAQIPGLNLVPLVLVHRRWIPIPQPHGTSGSMLLPPRLYQSFSRMYLKGVFALHAIHAFNLEPLENTECQRNTSPSVNPWVFIAYRARSHS